MRLPARGCRGGGRLGRAGLLHAITGHRSRVLLLAPAPSPSGTARPGVTARRQGRVDAAFLQLVSDDDSRFSGMAVTILRRRARLLGLPPRLIDVRIVRGPDDSHWAVSA